MDDSINIRTCTLHDAERIVSLGIKTFRDTFDEVNTPENMMLYLNQTFTKKKIQKEIAELGSLFFLAEQDGDAIGYARIRTSKAPKELESERPLEIERLYADKRYLGKRVGYLLMSECLNYAREHGFDTVWLGVWEHNARAIAFYEKWGFKRFSEHVFMLGKDPQTDHMMMKKI
jgi:ribosomal protein S18 acetylase RimI-like enzyme